MHVRIEAARVDQEVDEQTVLPIAGGLEIVHAPGHSLGQVLVLWKQHGGVLFVADAAVNVGFLAASPVYEDWQVARQTLERIGSGVFQVACFGHGKPILKNASRRFQRRWRKRK